ncbi:MAG: hypothetical protein OEW60_05105 [Thiovulaceae bacterium]|nr:hypothetical protein [Sulfurimonadaceae bacterium]
MKDETHSELVAKIKELESKIEHALEAGKEKFSYEMKQGKAIFSKEVSKLHQKELRGLFTYFTNIPFKMFVTAPIIYSMLFPALILDLFITVYQWSCFPIYKIKKVQRKDHMVFDRHRLKYLNIIEKINCMYCSYANGLLSYASEIAGRTELFFCPIKHATHLKKTHDHYKDFIAYGDYKDYSSELKKLRDRLNKEMEGLEGETL